MQCREAQQLISAERDGAREPARRAALVAHLEQCGGCRKARETLAAAADAWRANQQAVPAPDADLEWQKVRRMIRAGGSPAPGRRFSPAWITLPFAALAAAAVVFFGLPTTDDEAGPRETPAIAAGPNSGTATSTVVFVDDKSGYVFVWADDSGQHI